MYDDRRHQFANGCELLRAAALQLISQFLDGELVPVDGFRMQGDDSICLLGAFEPGHDLSLFGLKLLHPADELFRRHAGDDDAVNDPLHLASNLAESLFQPHALGSRFFVEPLAFGIVGIDELGDHLGMGEVIAQSLDCQRLNVIEVNASAVGARSALSVR